MVYVFHQVNCLGAFGAGFAKYLADVSYDVKKDYINHVRTTKNKENLLGTYLVSKLSKDISIVHLFSQYGYGRNKRYTNYSAMEKAISSFFRTNGYDSGNIYICPYNMGCGLAGGDWRLVSKIVDKYNIEPVKDIKIDKNKNLIDFKQIL